MAPLALTFKASVGSHGLTIEGLHVIWAARRSGTQKTTDEFRAIIREFQAFVVGEYQTDQAANVKKEHLVEYRNHLTKEGFKDKTITKKISTIKTLFCNAVDDSKLAPSEVQSFRVGKAKKRGKGGTKARLPFEIVELKKIFSPAIYLKTPGAIKGSHTEYWAPLVSLHSGLRIEEVCQLRVSDVREHEGQPFFRIIDGEDQELKNDNARRNVPIHEDLIRCGFMDFVQAGRKARNEWLFSELKADKYGRKSSTFGKRWNRKLRKVISLKAEDHTKVFHSFRHLFKHIARQCKIQEQVHDALSGHGSKQTEGRKYGALSYPEEPLFEGMKQFKIAGLDLSHLYVSSLSSQSKNAQD
jgi:integrase